MRCEQVWALLWIDKQMVVKQYKQYLSWQSVRSRPSRDLDASTDPTESEFQLLALFYQWFLESQEWLLHNTKLQRSVEWLTTYAMLDSTHPLAQLLWEQWDWTNDNSNSTEYILKNKEKLLSSQLRREQQREWMSADQKAQSALPVVQWYLRTLVRERVKHPDSTSDDKQLLIWLLKVAW